MTDPLQVVLAGGSPLLRAGLVEALARGVAIRIAANVADVAAVVRTSQGGSGDVLVAYLDQARTAVQILSAVTAGSWRGRCLVLTESDDIDDLMAALGVGILGYGVLDAVQPHDLVAAVAVVARGEMWLCARSTKRLLDLAFDCPTPLPLDVGADPSSYDLSAREREVLQLMANGHDEHEMSESLILSRNTIKTYVRRIREKLHVSSRSDALRLAYQLGLIPDRRRAPRVPTTSPSAPSARVSEPSSRGRSA